MRCQPASQCLIQTFSWGDGRMSDAEIEQELVELAVAGDRGALLKLLGRSRQSLCGYVARRIPAVLRGEVDAEDVVQNAHIEVFRRISSFESRGAGSFDRWVRTITARKLLDAIRRRRAVKRGGGRAAVGAANNFAESMIALVEWVAGDERSPSRVVARAEAVGAMQAAMDQLPPDYRKAMWMVHIEGRSTADVARELHRSEAAVRVLCHKARKRLRALLGDRSRYLSSS